ncbi:MAG: enolase C-terminal domain-like protein [Pseudomonadota bacterium]|nr:enolase C-terminal domain-like protein [Pseudomonadota bacterium]
MAGILSFELSAVELPFRKPFKHAAAERSSSYSLFLKCTTDSGAVGFGESLPREYVTGESRGSAFAMLRDNILPRLLGKQFDSMQDVESFLHHCNGQTPGWVAADVPQTAAWCAVDLALLDAFGKTFGARALSTEPATLPADFRYSGVLSADKGWRLIKSALKQRLFGIRQVKLKVDDTEDVKAVRLLRRVFGRNFDVRVDTNMIWDVEQAVHSMRDMARCGVTSFEQPVAAEDIEGLAWLVEETGLNVMADESLTTGASLQRLIETKACTAANVRVSKCGGLVAALNRSREALAANMSLQLGCQVGESSLLSAAHMRLAQAVQPVTYAEGCFGLFLLREDPVVPLLQFGYGGRPPQVPQGNGLGVNIDENVLDHWTVEKARVE